MKAGKVAGARRSDMRVKGDQQMKKKKENDK
jgi:hypothetical protein